MKLIGYARVSRTGGRSGEGFISFPEQHKAIESYCKAHSHTVTFLDDESDVSGGTMDRPIFNEALSLVKSGESDGLIVAKLDRFARNTAGALQTLQEIEEAGGVLISVAEPDASGAVGTAMRSMMLVFAQMENDRKREATDQAQANAVARGIHGGNRRPIGYQLNADRILEPDEHAPLVRALFDGKAAGKSLTELERIAAAHGRRIAYPTVGKILRNRVYLGEARMGKHVNPTAHEPLVTVAQWDAAHARRNVASPARAADGEGMLLSGLVRCAGCRYKMGGDRTHPKASGERIRRYRCKKRASGSRCACGADVQANVLEPYVLEQFFAAIGPGGVLARPMPDDADNDELAALEEAATAEQAELDFWINEAKASVIGMHEYAQRLAALTERRDTAAAAYSAALAVSTASATLPPAGQLLTVWSTLGVQEQRGFLHHAIAAIIVRQGKGHISSRVRILMAGADLSSFPGRGKTVPFASYDFN